MMHFLLMNRYKTMLVGPNKYFLITGTYEGHEDSVETTLQCTLKCQHEFIFRGKVNAYYTSVRYWEMSNFCKSPVR